MDKRSVLVVSLLSLFLLFSFRGYADLIFSNDTANPSGTVYYVLNQTYNFSIILQNTSFPLSSVLFEWNGINETATGNASIDENTTQFFVDKVDLPANETGLSYRWFASDINANSSYSNLQSYIINRSSTTINLFLDNIENDKTYNLKYQNANFTSLLNVPGKNITLDSNMTGFPVNSLTSTITKIINLTNSGLFYVNASFAGDQNYSSSFTNYYFYVTPWSNSTASPSSPVTYLQYRNYQFNVTWQNKTPINNVYFAWNGINIAPTGNRTIDANTTEFYLNETDLPANPSGYPYSISVNYTNGNITSSDQWNYIINQIPISLSWTSPSSNSPWTVTAGTTGTTVRCLANDSISLTLCINSGSVTNCVNSTGSVSDSPISSVQATYYYTCSPTNTNYSGGPLQGTLYFQVTNPNPSNNQGNGGQQNPSGTFSIKGLTSALTAMTGQSTPTSFTVSNNLQNPLINVSITVSGIDSSWYSLSNFNSTIGHGLSQPMTITFNIPDSAEAKTYDVTITAAGKDILTKLLKTYTATMKLTVNSSQPQPIQPLPSETVESPTPTTSQDNSTANITSNQTSVATGLAPAFEFFKDNLVIILAIAVCLLIFIFRNNLTTALGGTLGKEEPETHKAKSASPLKGIKDKLNYKIVVNLKKESKAKDLKETAEVQGAEKVPEVVPEKGPKRPAMLEKEIKRDINELQSILEAEKKVGKNKKKFDMKNN